MPELLKYLQLWGRDSISFGAGAISTWNPSYEIGIRHIDPLKPVAKSSQIAACMEVPKASQ